MKQHRMPAHRAGLLSDPMAGFSLLNLVFPLIYKKLSSRCHQRTKQRTIQNNHLSDLLDVSSDETSIAALFFSSVIKEPLTELSLHVKKMCIQANGRLLGRVWNLYEPSAAIGVVSAVGRCWGRAIQTDAAISPVNYGGPLLNIEGRVIGVIAPLPAETAGMSTGTELYDSGVGFAIPIHDIIPLIPRLKDGQMLKPGLLGIGYSTTDPINGRPVVETVRTGSPAAKSGLQSGDLITEINGQSIQRIADIRHTGSQTGRRCSRDHCPT